MSGGGGGSGKVEYPAHMVSQHTIWLGQIDTIIDTALAAASPYNGVTAFDPGAAFTPTAASPLALTQDMVTALEATVTGIDDTVDWKRFVDAAELEADLVLFDTDVLEDARTAFNNRSEDEFLNGVNNLSNWAGGVGAVDSSAFPIGLALLEMDRERRVDDFDANLQFELYKIRGQFVLASVQSMAGLLSMRVDGELAATQVQYQQSAATIIAKKEQNDTDVEWDVQDSLYDIKLFAYGGAMMSSISGGVFVPKEPSQAQSALSGALGGAAKGLSASGGNPWVGLGGAALGGLAGLLS